MGQDRWKYTNLDEKLESKQGVMTLSVLCCNIKFQIETEIYA